MKIRHEGLHADRLKPGRDNPREVAFANQWSYENDGGSGGNILACLLVNDHGDLTSVLSDKIERLAPFDQQSASVAATVVQWLGSNVGWCFLQESLARCGYEIVKKPENRR